MERALTNPRSLDSMVRGVDNLQHVSRSSLRPGDCLIVKTCNSTYTLRALHDGCYCVSGGWFDSHRGSSMSLRVNGCTWGGPVIKVDIIAALGLCVEFGNRVTTSPVQKIIVLPQEGQN